MGILGIWLLYFVNILEVHANYKISHFFNTKEYEMFCDIISSNIYSLYTFLVIMK